MIYLFFIWIGFGLLNYWIKYSNYKEDWKKPEKPYILCSRFRWIFIIRSDGLPFDSYQ